MDTFLLVYVIVNLVNLGIVAGLTMLILEWDVAYPLPHEIYDESEMNLFGCILLFIVFLVLCPIAYLFRIIYMLCHIGRE